MTVEHVNKDFHCDSQFVPEECDHLVYENCHFWYKHNPEETTAKRKGPLFKSNARYKTVSFVSCSFEGDGHPLCNFGPCVSMESGCQIERFDFVNCVVEGVTYGPIVNCSSGGFVGFINISDCVFKNIVNNNPPGMGAGYDPWSGKGLAVALNGNTENCQIKACVFADCERHSLYISNGGPVYVNGCTFIRNNVGGTTTWPLAAVAIGRGGNVYLTNSSFYSCRDDISLSDNDPNRPKPNIRIEDCLHHETERACIHFSDRPDIVGYFTDVVINRNTYVLTKPETIAWRIASFKDTKCINSSIYDLRGAFSKEPYPAIQVNGRFESKNLLIEGVEILHNRRNSSPDRIVSARGDLSTYTEELDVIML